MIVIITYLLSNTFPFFTTVKMSSMDEPASPESHELISLPRIEDASYYEDMAISPPLSSPSPTTPPPPALSPPQLDALLALKECADYELFTDKKEERTRLIKLVEALKHKGCNFHILPPRAQF